MTSSAVCKKSNMTNTATLFQSQSYSAFVRRNATRKTPSSTVARACFTSCSRLFSPAALSPWDWASFPTPAGRGRTRVGIRRNTSCTRRYAGRERREAAPSACCGFPIMFGGGCYASATETLRAGRCRLNYGDRGHAALRRESAQRMVNIEATSHYQQSISRRDEAGASAQRAGWNSVCLMSPAYAESTARGVPAASPAAGSHIHSEWAPTRTSQRRERRNTPAAVPPPAAAQDCSAPPAAPRPRRRNSSLLRRHESPTTAASTSSIRCCS